MLYFKHQALLGVILNWCNFETSLVKQTFIGFV